MAKQQSNQSSNKKLWIGIVILILVFLLLLSGVLYYFLAYVPNQSKNIVGGKREAEALQGSLNLMTEAEVQDELNRIVEEGMFRISIASTIVAWEDGTAQVRIENNENNRYVMQVSIYLDETGEEIHATDLIDPGYYIAETVLDKPLERGEYDATAIFTALYPETEEIVGTAGAKVQFVVFRTGETPPPSPTPSPTPEPTPSAESSPSAEPTPSSSSAPSQSLRPDLSIESDAP